MNRNSGTPGSRVLAASVFGLLVGCSGSNNASFGGAGGENSGGNPTGTGGTGTAGNATGTGGTSGGGSTGTGGTSTGTGGSPTGTGGAGPGDGGAGAPGKPYPISCDDIGTEPTIPPPCKTLTATKSAPGGVLASESPLDTTLIADAIAACPAGQSVKLVASGNQNAFISGAFNMKAGVTLWIDTGVTLFASRYPTDFDVKAGACGGNNTGSGACRPLIGVNGAGVGVMGSGTIDGRGGEPVGNTASTWWDLENSYAGKLAAPRLIQTTGGSDFTLYGVTLKNSPKFHVVIDGTNGFVVWGVTINTPADSPNTDGVDPSGAKNGVFAYNKFSTGDDNIALKGSGPVMDNIIVAHNHFGRGHGMSIGSETYGGVKNVKVCDLSLDGTDNGLRIKSDSSRGGLVQDISYTGVCMRKVKHPLVFDPYYSSSTGTQIPDFQGISLKDVHVLDPGSSEIKGYDASHKLSITFDNVIFDGVAAATFDAVDATVTLGPGPVNFKPSGTDVTVTNQVTGTDAALDCSNAWVTF